MSVLTNPSQGYFDPTTLRLFIAACEEQSLAAAAEREAIVPSAVSKRLSALEEQAGVALLKRSRRGIAPTAAGEVMLRRARDILAAMQRTALELEEFGTGTRGKIRVLASLSVVAESLPDDIGAFLARHKQVTVSLEERISSEIISGVRDGLADFGVCWDGSDFGNLKRVHYRRDTLCVVVPPVHPLLGRESVSFEDTLDYEHVGINPGGSLNIVMRRYATGSGKVIRQRIEVNTFGAAARCVVAGMGLVIMPFEIAQVLLEPLKLKALPLNDTWADRRFILCMRSRASLSTAARLLADHLQERAAGEPVM